MNIEAKVKIEVSGGQDGPPETFARMETFFDGKSVGSVVVPSMMLDIFMAWHQGLMSTMTVTP